MPVKYLIFAFLLTMCFGYIQNEHQTYRGFVLWPKKTQMLEMKEIKASFSNGSMPGYNDTQAVVTYKTRRNSTENPGGNKKEDGVTLDDVKTSWKPAAHMNSSEEQMKTNRIKREIDSSMESMESMESAEDSDQVPTGEHIPKQTNKRQTTIIGNGNRLSNLINLPVRLNVLANVLSKLNQGILDTKETSSGSITINGSDNTISSLVNAPVDVDAVVNLLSQVDISKKGSTSGASKGGVVDGLLGGLLGGGKAAGKGNKGLVGGLLDGVLGDGNGSGLLGGLLGNSLGDLLGALLGSNGVVGNLLGGVNGKGLVTDLLHNLLGGVVGLVDHLLELLVGILDGLLVGMAGADVGVANGAASQGPNIAGHHNQISSLVNAPVRVEALINALSSLRQELRQQLEPAATVKQSTNIKGNNNQVSSLINLPVDLNLDLNLLSSVDKTAHHGTKPRALESSSSDASPPASTLLGSVLVSSPNDIPSSSASSSPGSSLLGSLLGPSAPSASLGQGSLASGSPVLPASGSTNIQGDGNAISSLLNVVPDVDLNLNLLSDITDLLVGSSDGGGVQDAGNPNEICFDIPISNADSTITGDNNKISNAINVKPKIHLDLNLLSSVKESAASKGPTQRVCIKKPTQPLAPAAPTTKPSAKPTPKPSATPSLPAITPTIQQNEICFNILVDQSGTVVKGHDNQLISLVNVEPTVNLGLNLLSSVQQTNAPGNLVMKRICIPGPSTVAPIHNPPHSRCFKRTCTKWKQFLDYKCLNNQDEYPKYTITREI